MAATTMLALLMCMQIRPLGPDQAPPLRPVPTMGGVGAAVAAADADNPMLSEAMRGDARLADVCFAGPQQGWAVGDRGVIWHTEDGGRQWYLQPSGVGCTLESVCFLDEKVGWVAGGFSHPYTHASSGVLLTTTDGGRHWQTTPGPLLPALKQVRFFDEKHGWAVACPSAMFPSGVLTTDNGGRSWSPLPGTMTAGWLAGDLLDPRTGALAGRSGKTAVVRDAGVEPARMGSFGLRNLRRMTLVAPVHGWLVGDGGLLMMTGDLGASWQTPPGPLPEGLAEQFDFQALAVRGPQAWVAGTPGTRVLHSPDAGRTWQAFATGVQTPIHGLAFADDRHGWAVGALGTILATSDGGQSWQRQRAGGGRAALLGLFGDGGDVPLELFAQHSGDDGYLGVVELLNRRDVEVEPRSEAHPADRVHEALVGVGGSDASTAWRFPLRQAGLPLSAEQIIGVWDQVNDGRGLAELEAHVVRQIRMWRPEVIVTHGVAPGGDPLGQLLNQVVLRAVAEAADPTQFTRQITHVGLEPWEVKKVYGMLDHAAREGTDLSTAQLAVRLGSSLADVAAMPRGLLENQFTAPEATLGFRLLVDHLPQGTGQRDMFSGIVLSPGSDARRPLSEIAGGNLAALQAVAQRQRNVRAILERSEKDPQGSTALLAQTGQLVQGLDGGSAGRILYQLGQSYYRAGRWPAAADTFELLAQRYPDHPLAQPAMLWLVQYYAGSEPAWRVQGEQRYAVQQASALSIDVSQQDQQPDHAAQLAKQIEQTRPELFLEEALRFPLAVAHRSQGFPRQAERYFLARAHGADDDAWSAVRGASSGWPSRRGCRRSRCCTVRWPRRSRCWTAVWTTRSGVGPCRPSCTARSATTPNGRPWSDWPTTPSSSTWPSSASGRPGRSLRRSNKPARETPTSRHTIAWRSCWTWIATSPRITG